MQYPRYLPLAALVVGCVGCVEGGEPAPEPRDDCEQASDPKVLDIELSGLDDTRTYLFVVDADGARVSVARTPEQRSTFAEGALPTGGALVVSLDPDTLRVFVDGAAAAEGPRSVRVTAWSRAALLVETTFMPAYEHAVPVEGDCFSTITEYLAIPPHE
jgi:hypothetical protein